MKRQSLLLMLVAALLQAPVGCSSQGNPTGTAICVPGQQVECACPGGAPKGAQKCLPGGNGYGDCFGCAGGAGSGTGGAGGGGGATSSGSGGADCGCVPGTVLACVSPCGTTGAVTCTDTCQIPNDCVPPVEICNGLDDDCQNGPDDDRECVQGATLPCTTTCGSAGSRTCSLDCIIPAECAPPVEICNGADEDCDGVADDSLALFGQPFSLGGVDPRRPMTAYANGVYAVVYLDLGFTPRRLRLQRFDSTGLKLGIAVDVDVTTAGPGAIAWNGSSFGIAWSDTYSGTGVYFRSYNSDGTPLTPVTKVDSSNAQSGVAFINVGNEYLVAFDNYTGIFSGSFKIVKCDALGQTLQAQDITPVSARVILPQLAPAPVGYRLFWSDNRSGKYAIFARGLAADGSPTGPEVATTDGTADAELWSVAQVQQGYALGYSNFDAGTSLLLATDGSGMPVAPPVVVGTSKQFPEVAWTGSLLAMLNGDTFQFRNSQLQLIAGPFVFHTPVTNNIRYSGLLWAAGRYFGVAGTDGGPSDPAVGRIFGQFGCSAP